MEFMGVSIMAEGLTEYETEGTGFASWARVSAPKQGAPIGLVVTAKDAFAIFESRPNTMGEEGFTLTVPVQWSNNGPSTRQKGVDNVDIILLDRNTRHFLDIQVGVVVRGGWFYLTAQKIWQGWIMGSSMEDLQFVPSDPKHAYPGADYASIWRGMAQVMTFVWSLIKDLGEGPGDVKPAEWAPPVSTARGDMTKGYVMYFNMITGTGLVWMEDNRGHFVHFSAIEDEKQRGHMKVLVPMSVVKVTLNKDLKAVHSCSPVAA